MTYVIGKECIDALDRSCIDVCPVDCIYEGARKSYINPVECIDCGACELACPEVAIFPARKARTDEQRKFLADNASFFSLPLPGKTEPLGSPGGGERISPVGTDTPFIGGWPKR
ncbi:MAG: 4Fe-4S binding protein [Phycicoccus sp.]|nr:4Fe-4S binding protein [Phycicoccus sp.]